MFVYRIVKALKRTKDLSGTGAFKNGGRWNSKGSYMLYTSETSSLAYLESLVHFDDAEYPPNLWLMKIEIDAKAKFVLLKETDYPEDWQELDLLQNKSIGDNFLAENKFLALKVKSVINPYEYNVLLNPLFPGFHDLVKVINAHRIEIDDRLID